MELLSDSEIGTLRGVCAHFPLKGAITDFSAIKNGNINKTYAVYTDRKTYLLQQVNANVFTDPDAIIRNIRGVTSYIYDRLPETADRERLVMRVFDTSDGHQMYIDDNGSYWRLLSYITDSVCFNIADAKILENTGRAFGGFLASLADYPMDSLNETIKDFHNTPKRVEDLRKSFERDVCGRRREVEDECSFIFAQDYYIRFFEDAYRDGKLPKRVTHNDTKCNNVMFDTATLEPLAVIDLDTVMPGFAAHDFGDAVRFGANTRAEDDPDISGVAVDLGKYESFCRGYMGAVKGRLTSFELETLYIGAVTITLEIAARFLADYLDGDKYFICRRERHNYFRGVNQTALLKSELENISNLKDIAAKYSR